MLDLLDVKYLIAVAKQGGISKAAQKVGLTQPALTRRIKKLEDKFDTKLLIRNSDGASLTPVGEAFIENGQGLLAHLADFEKKMQQRSKGGGGRIAVGIKPGLYSIFIRKTLQRFEKKYPHTKVALQVASTPFLMQYLVNGDIDFAFGALGYADEKDTEIVLKSSLVYQPFIRLPLVPVVSKGHPVVKDESNPERLFEYPTVGPRAPISILNKLKEQYHRMGVAYSVPQLVVDDYAIACDVVRESNSYWAMLFEPDLAFFNSDSQLVAINGMKGIEPMEIGIVCRSSWTPDETDQFFIDVANEVAMPWLIKK